MHYCRLQDGVSLSSGEAELKAVCKALAEGLGVQALAKFLTGAPCALEHLGDASAAYGILLRSGAGSLKHLEVKQLWVQEVARRADVSTIKIPREFNLADAMSSAQTVENLRIQLDRMGYHQPPASV